MKNESDLVMRKTGWKCVRGREGKACEGYREGGTARRLVWGECSGQEDNVQG